MSTENQNDPIDSSRAVATRTELLDQLDELLCKMTGVRSKTLARRLASQLATLLTSGTASDVAGNENLIGALETLRDLTPKSAAEAMLAVTDPGCTRSGIIVFEDGRRGRPSL